LDTNTQAKMKIVIDQKIPFIKGVLEQKAEIKYLPGDKINAAAVKDADALIIRTRTRCDKNLLEGSKVSFIASATIGFDHIDTAYCKKAGIYWTNAPGCNSSSVEQYIVSVLLYFAQMNEIDLKKTTVGIVGLGNVGTKVKRALNALGCNCLVNDPPREKEEGSDGYTDLKDLLSQSDIVSLHVPLTSSGPYSTEKMADRDFFESMKKGACFINSSRGEVVDEDALKEAIRSDKLGEVALDVYRNEPHVDQGLLAMLSIATPHIAGYSSDGKANGTEMSVQSVSRYFKLGMDDWKVKNIPQAGDKELLMDLSEGEFLDILSEVYSRTYQVMEDHDRFMDAMDQFEKLRGNYRVRREASAYRLRLFNDDGLYRKVFEGLGFEVLADSCM